MHNKQLISFLKYVAIVGNIVLLLWFLFTRINEEFKGSVYQKFSSVGLISLLVTTIFLLFIRNKQEISFLRYIAGLGNALFLFWILFNGIMEGFKAPLTEIFYYIAVMGLLASNSILLLLSSKTQQAADEG